MHTSNSRENAENVNTEKPIALAVEEYHLRMRYEPGKNHSMQLWEKTPIVQKMEHQRFKINMIYDAEPTVITPVRIP
jgi:hypothetical protein